MKVHLMRSGGKKGKREFKRDADGQIKSGRGVMRGGEEERGGMRLKQRCMNTALRLGKLYGTKDEEKEGLRARLTEKNDTQ